MINDDLMGFNRDLMGINGDHRHECWLKHVKTVIFGGAGVPIGFIQGPRRENHGGVELQRLREGIPAMLHLFPVAWDVSI